MIQYPITLATAVASYRACLEGGYAYTARNIALDARQSANMDPARWGAIADEIDSIPWPF